MTKERAEMLAKQDKSYRARKFRGAWIVWCDASNHEVEFDSEGEEYNAAELESRRRLGLG